MEKINLQAILEKHKPNLGNSVNYWEALSLMKEVWNLAVDECLKANWEDPNSSHGASIQQVKQMI